MAKKRDLSEYNENIESAAAKLMNVATYSAKKGEKRVRRAKDPGDLTLEELDEAIKAYEALEKAVESYKEAGGKLGKKERTMYSSLIGLGSKCSAYRDEIMEAEVADEEESEVQLPDGEPEYQDNHETESETDHQEPVAVAAERSEKDAEHIKWLKDFRAKNAKLRATLNGVKERQKEFDQKMKKLEAPIK